jgi:hypothetical protein
MSWFSKKPIAPSPTTSSVSFEDFVWLVRHSLVEDFYATEQDAYNLAYGSVDHLKKLAGQGLRDVSTAKLVAFGVANDLATAVRNKAGIYARMKANRAAAKR